MPLAGEIVTPTTRDSSARTSSSAGFTTTATVVDTITVSLVNGETYEVEWVSQFSDTVAADRVLVALCEDNAAGTQLFGYFAASPNPTSAAFPIRVLAEYTAVATGSKTFVGVLQRVAGTGTITSGAGSTAPSRIIVRQV